MENTKTEYADVNVVIRVPAKYNKALAESAQASGRTKKAEAEVRMLASLEFHSQIMNPTLILDKEGNRREY